MLQKTPKLTMVLSTKSRRNRRKKSRRSKKRYSRRSKLPGTIRGDVKQFKLKGTVNFNSNGAGANFDTFSDTQPGAFYNGGTALQDLTNVAALFEQYRINAVKLRFFPFLSNASTGQYPPLYIIYDPDDATALAAVSTAIEYDNVKVMDLSRPWTYYKKVVRSNTATGGVDVSMAPGFHDLAAAVSIGAIKFACTGMFVGTQYGTIVATYYMEFAIRR